MTEKSMWEVIRRNMKGSWTVDRHEDRVTLGVPDLSYAMNDGTRKVQGWIELKCIDKFNNDMNSVTPIKHFTGVQRRWLKTRQEVGGSTWLFLKVGRNTWMLFKGDVAAENVGRVSEYKLREVATGVWDDHMNWIDLAKALLYLGD